MRPRVVIVVIVIVMMMVRIVIVIMDVVVVVGPRGPRWVGCDQEPPARQRSVVMWHKAARGLRPKIENR